MATLPTLEELLDRADLLYEQCRDQQKDVAVGFMAEALVKAQLNGFALHVEARTYGRLQALEGQLLAHTKGVH